jgi:hypothetical protein
MSRLMFSALLLTSCAAEVPPRADAGDPRVMPVGAVAALDGSFSEGDGLSYAWSVEPEGATLLDAESPFATLIAEAPGFYTLSLEVCDESGRCDTAETWARVDAPSNANKVSDWGLGEFASAESGAGAPFDPFKGNKEWCYGRSAHPERRLDQRRRDPRRRPGGGAAATGRRAGSARRDGPPVSRGDSALGGSV